MDKTDLLAKQFLDHVLRANTNRQAHNVFDLTILSFLLDHRLVTLEGLDRRIALVRSALPENYRSPETGAAIENLMSVLRAVYGPKPRGWTPQVIEGGKDRPPESDPDLPTK
jgi:hypothetical protein